MPNVTRYHINSRRFSKARYVAAVRQMRETPAPPFPNAYEKYIAWHADPDLNVVAHGGLAFLAWHRAFLWEFEKDLQAADAALGNDGAIGIPWWDWTADTSSDPDNARGRMWRNDFMGPTGRADQNFEVMSGPFVRANWPTWAGGGVMPTPPADPFLRRELGGGSALANAADINYVMGLSDFDIAPFNRSVPDTSFRNVLEGYRRRPGGAAFYHNGAHGWIGGNMNDVLRSPYDPAFYLNHANVDRLWAVWQARHPRLADQWPTDDSIDAAYPPPMPRPRVPKLDEPMAPWTGAPGTRIWTPRSVLAWQLMGDHIHAGTGAGVTGEHQYRYSSDARGSFRFT